MKHANAPRLRNVTHTNAESDAMPITYAIKEGMADFIGELISGKNSNERLIIWPTSKEKKNWESFKKEVYLNRYAHRHTGNVEHTKDAANPGYWIGYQLCESYFNKAADKKQAIYTMMHDDIMHDERFRNLISA